MVPFPFNRWRIFLLALGWLLPFHGAAQSLFWSISKPETNQHGFLFGTIHLAHPEVLDLPSGLTDSLLNCKVLALELNPDENTLAEILGSMEMKHGTRLGQLLSIADYLLIEKYFNDSLGMPLKYLDQVQPLFLASMVGNPVMEGGGVPLDIHLFQIAKYASMPVIGLESTAFQMSLFDSIPYALQAAELLSQVHQSLSSDQTEMRDLLDLYLRADLEAMVELMSDHQMGERFRTVFIDQRNHQMVASIEVLLEQHKAFVAVGAAHLGGSTGMLQLLRQQGYIVSPMDAP